ncbi:hypothetical protein FT663_03765 [Candidozyma haemuli var. vulneris]|uniref:Uncharacterized protein n=1 Tax=Candidozyma haemuli TaxID=45357 RepID=A0A2V1ARC4_9ASCO|nr:hypothetical protein CXQ85_002186 [[Candida] haemuloni]KAF3989094.1 hypothetical protein FT663_03765 [[Candida] haemuloni var. vulneris]KAF3991193.1 hypothetical protein FT662_01868 [[Candida] haemuloni var. vulneris]PVH20398.1 hypothetical protein CXQ85_002186 [[Candida] haemuloni]
MSDIKVQTSELTEVDGSARLTVGNTTVLVSVAGPIEAKPRQELPTQASLEIVVRPSRGVSSTREKVLEDLLRSVLQSTIIRYRYPRQLIQIVVQFLTTDVDREGSIVVSGDTAASGGAFTSNELSAALNASYFALVDANVALYNSFASISVAIDSDGKIIENPSLKQLQNSNSHHVVCFEIREKQAQKMLLVESDGSFSEEQLLSVIELGADECQKIHSTIQRPIVEEKVNQDFIWAN